MQSSADPAPGSSSVAASSQSGPDPPRPRRISHRRLVRSPCAARGRPGPPPSRRRSAPAALSRAWAPARNEPIRIDADRLEVFERGEPRRLRRQRRGRAGATPRCAASTLTIHFVRAEEGAPADEGTESIDRIDCRRPRHHRLGRTRWRRARRPSTIAGPAGSCSAATWRFSQGQNVTRGERLSTTSTQGWPTSNPAARSACAAFFSFRAPRQ